MLYGVGSFDAASVAPGQERLEESATLRFVLGKGAYGAEYTTQRGTACSRTMAAPSRPTPTTPRIA